MNKIHLIGNAHLDPTWLWRWQEGCGEVLQTFRSAVDRLNEYDDFVFTCSSACYYKWVEEIDPDLFEEIKEKINEGRWVPVNGWWVQPDCNMPSAESFARQALYSQLYYYEKFGKICRVGYNVDSFGHNAMIPQMLKNAGMNYYVMMRPNMSENPDIPQGLFWWDSADGSRVLTFRIPRGYAENGKRDIDTTIDVLHTLSETYNTGMMMFYGVGNHGGGPTKGDLDYIHKLIDEGMTELTFSSPEVFFNEQVKLPMDIPSWQSELQHHASGCYSATSLIKKLNRQAENAIINSEKWDVIASLVCKKETSADEIKNAWLKVCYNQFHDIMCGCSIREAYDDAAVQMGSAIDASQKIENKALLRLTNKIDTWLDGVSDSVSFNERHECRNIKYPRPVVVFNPLSTAVKTAVQTYHPSKFVTDSEGNPVLFSNVRSSRSNDTHLDTCFNAEIPGLGYATYWLWDINTEKDEKLCETDIKVDGLCVENKYLRVVFDEATGGVKSLFTKSDSVEHLAHVSLVPTVIDNSKPDTWAHNIFSFKDVIGTAKPASIKVIESSGIRAVVRIRYEYNKSYISQDYILESESEALRCKVRILWQEPLTMVKTSVNITGENPVGTYEIPGGFIKRTCNGNEEPALTWGDVTAGNNGVSIISDAKYSYDCLDNSLSLTMLRNSIFADHYSDRPDADFEYCDEGLQRFEYMVYPHSGNAEHSHVQCYADVLNNKPVAVPVSYHKGSEKQVKSFISVSKDNISLMCFKKCEDNSGDYIIRLRETKGKAVKCAVVCDLIDAGFWADFREQEIKTFRIDSEGFVKEVDFLEGIVK